MPALAVLLLLFATTAVAQESRADKEFAFAEQLYKDELFRLAAKQFQDFAEAYPNHVRADEAWFLSGLARFRARDYDAAFDAFKELELTYPRSKHLAEARFYLAQARARQGDLAGAAVLFQRVSLLHPESKSAIRALLQAGRAFEQLGRLQDARSAYFKILSDHPDAPERLQAHLAIVQTYLSEQNYDEALAQVDGIFRAFGPDFKDARVTYVRAQIFLELGQEDAAEALFKRIVEEFPETPQSRKAQLALGEIYARRGELEAALAAFDLALSGEAAPNVRNRAWLAKGDVLTRLGRLEEAASAYRQVDPLQTERPWQVRYKRAAAELELGRYERADAAFAALIAAAKADSTVPAERVERALHNRVRALLALKRPRKALQVLAEFEARQPDRKLGASLAFRKAEILERELGDPTRALRAYDAFLDAFPQSSRVDEAQAAIGRCYEKLGDFRKAYTEYVHYLERFPGGEDHAWVERRAEQIAASIDLDPDRALRRVTAFLTQPRRGDEVEANRSELELARLYYEVRDFEAAVATLKHVLRTGVATDGVGKSEIYYLLGDAYARLAQRATLVGDVALARSYRDSAAISFRFVQAAEPSRWSEAAFHILTRMQLDTLRASGEREAFLRKTFLAWLERYPDGARRDYILYQFGNQLLQNADRADTTRLQAALSYFRELQRDFSESRYRTAAAFRESQVLVRLGNDSLALAKLRPFVQAPRANRFTPAALLELADLYRRLGAPDSARATLTRLREAFFYTRAALQAELGLADLTSAQGDAKGTLQHLARYRALAAETNAGADAVLLREARAYEALGEVNRALGSYLAFLQQNGSHPEADTARFAVARLARAQKRYAFAREYYENMLAQASTDLVRYRAHVELGDLLFQEQRYRDARRHYLSALALASTSEQGRYPTSQAIRCRYQLKEFAAADADAKVFKNKYDDTEPEQAQFLEDKANAYMQEKRFELAEKTFKKLRDFKEPEFRARGEFGLGAVYLITNHTEDALKILTALPGKYPDSEVVPKTYLNLGDFYYKNQQVENAIAAFKQVLKHPKAGEYYKLALRYLIRCYNDVRMWDQAIALNREYLERYPHAQDAFDRKVEIARNLMHLKEYPRALEHFRRLLVVADPETEAEVQFYLGQCYKEMGDFERATTEYLKVKYLTQPTKLPWHTTALFEAADCLVRLNEPEQAKRILQRIVVQEGAESKFGRFARQKLDQLQQAGVTAEKRDRE